MSCRRPDIWQLAIERSTVKGDVITSYRFDELRILYPQCLDQLLSTIRYIQESMELTVFLKYGFAFLVAISCRPFSGAEFGRGEYVRNRDIELLSTAKSRIFPNLRSITKTF